jgi:dTDP-4-dehydrorhamnose 3,5-epimerase
MKIESTFIAGVKVIESPRFEDSRGFFIERAKAQVLQSQGIQTAFVQLNHSRSLPNVLRGLHAQQNPAQAKMVGCVRGKVFDVAVDVRRGSPTYGKWFGMELSGENGKMMYVPEGCLHGFCVLGEEPADVIYQVSGYYTPEGEYGARFDDPFFNVAWPIQNPIVSDKDLKLKQWEV